ncbi:11991_t:CDS:2 [Acaulospora colombiana]|uniref:11991_t:CDS:1 n=1 Tax=Acaulospora colombiana TaxID=27376 RepID=A0ACA9KNX1_9GLOM|nr:11991_t:CDS:2 [Acaulospora colombiana]
MVGLDGEVTMPSTNPKYLAAGAIAGAVSRTATAPLDRLKVYLQIQTAVPKVVSDAGGKLSRGAVVISSNSLTNAVKEIYAGGILNFFRGNGLNVAKIAPESAIKFFAYEKSKAIVAQLTGAQDTGSIGMPGRFLKGSVEYGGGNVAGAGLPIILQGIGTVVEKEQLKGKEPSAWVSLSCGMISGSVGATIVYPLSLVRTRLQAQGTSGHSQMYTGAFDVIRKTYAKEQMRGFYKGLIPALSKVMPAAAITYVVYDKCKSIFSLE